MKLPCPTPARLVRTLGTLLLSVSGLGFLGWMQSRDPDCLLGDVVRGALLQLRMCEAYIDTAQGAPWWQLAALAGTALAGWLCLRIGRRLAAAGRFLSSATGSPRPRGPCRPATAATARR